MRILAGLIVVLTMLGCGGGGGTGQTANVNATIDWAARSRNLSAPSSALSATFTLVGAKPGGGDFSFIVNRDANPAAYTKSYTSHSQARVGTWPLHVRFYSTPDGHQEGGQGGGGINDGDIVGLIDAVINLKADGSGIGNFTTTGTITQVTVNPGQVVGVGQTTDLYVATFDGNGRFVPVTLGSVFVKLVGGGGFLRVTPQNQIQGLAVGTAQVVATVDGIQSNPEDVTVAYVPTVTITPPLVGVFLNGSLHFTATVTSTPDTSVIWSVEEGASGGTIDQNGVYVAPSTPGTYHVMAASHYRTLSTAIATVIVNPPTTGGPFIYVSDAGNNRIVRMDDMTGHNWAAIGTSGSGTYQFANPHIFVTSSGVIYVADEFNNRVIRMDDITGKNWTAFGSIGSGFGQFNGPNSISVGSDGKIYVTDYYNNRLVRMDDITGSGWTTLGFFQPLGCTVDSSNQFYVADLEDPGHRGWIVRGTSMSVTGLSIYTNFNGWNLSGPIWPDSSGGMFVVDRSNREIFHLAGPNDPAPTRFSSFVGEPWYQLPPPSSVIQAADGRLYWTFTSYDDSGHGIARVDGLSGSNLNTLGKTGSGIAQFWQPNGIYVR